MSKKIDVRIIVQDHLATLKDARTRRPSAVDLLVFFGLPLVLAATLITAGLKLQSTEIAILITALSIFAALLFNLLLLIHSIVTGTGPTEQTQLRRELLQEVYANISYAILLAVIAITLLLIDVVASNSLLSRVIAALVCFLVAHFVLTLFLVLKRIHSMLAAEFKSS